MSRVNTIPSVRPLWQAQQAVQSSTERMATGLRINRASDDPSGLIAAEAMSARQAELTGRINALERESVFLSAKDGALGALGSVVADLDAMAVRAANASGLGGGEMDSIRSEAAGVASAIDRAASSTSFGGSSLLRDFDAGSLGRTQVGTDGDGNPVYASVRDMDRLLAEDPSAAQAVARQAVEDVAVAQAEVGLRERAIDAERRAAETEFINTADALSRTRDTDYARETSDAATAGVMQQAAVKALLIGRQSRARAMELLLG